MIPRQTGPEKRGERPPPASSPRLNVPPVRSASTTAARPPALAVKQDSVFYIELEKIKPNPYQPRRDFDAEELNGLADSMKRYGLLQPLLVSKVETETPGGTKVEYQLIAGERRLKAAALAGLKQAPVIIKNADDGAKLEMALIENLQRRDLNPLEEAAAYTRLINEFGLTQPQVAEKVGKSREVVANRIRLLDLTQEAQTALVEGRILEGHAKVLLAVKNPERQRYLTEEVFKKRMIVRELEEIVKKEETYRPKHRALDPALEEYRRLAQDALGTTVVFSGSRERGRLAVNFYSEEDLDRIIKKLAG